MADEVTKHAPRAALITGAGRRIGATIALALARAGYAVVLHANHSREDAERLAQAITGAGARASVVLADLADSDAVRSISQRHFSFRKPSRRKRLLVSMPRS
jgi:NAD(P)-dependent dehydrogenase (short-subunit alcohol dehydrogenase family)